MKTMSHKHTVAGVFAMLFIATSGPFSRARCGILASGDIDYARLAGTWYEIARLPNRREEGLVNITTTFKLVGRDKIEVVNRGYKASNRRKPVTYTLTARLPEPDEPASLTVRYCGIFRFTYNVIELDTVGYQYAMISGDSPDDLWLFSRTPVMEEKVLDELVSSAKKDGFAVTELIRCPQNSPPLAATPETEPSTTSF